MQIIYVPSVWWNLGWGLMTSTLHKVLFMPYKPRLRLSGSPSSRDKSRWDFLLPRPSLLSHCLFHPTSQLRPRVSHVHSGLATWLWDQQILTVKKYSQCKFMFKLCLWTKNHLLASLTVTSWCSLFDLQRSPKDSLISAVCMHSYKH